MEDEQLKTLLEEVAGKIEAMPDGEEKPLTKKERQRRIVLQLQQQALQKIKAAKEKGSLNQEVRASLDYSLLEKYGEKHPMWLSFLRAQMWWWGF